MRKADYTQLVKEACNINTISEELLCKYNKDTASITQLCYILKEKIDSLFPAYNTKLAELNLTDDAMYAIAFNTWYHTSRYDNIVLTAYAFFATLPEEDLREYLSCLIA